MFRKLPIHVIWVEGSLKPEYVERIKHWKALNPEQEVNVWTLTPESIQKQFEEKNIHVKDFRSREDISPNIRNFIELLMKPMEGMVSNPGVISDLMRFIILNAEGGTYVDTDVKPIDLKALRVDKVLKFLVNGEHHENSLQLCPDFIITEPKTAFTQKTIECVNLMVEYFLENPKLIAYLRHQDIAIKYIATMLSTNAILLASLEKISADGKPFIHSEHGVFDDFTLFARGVSKLNDNEERSWWVRQFTKVDISGKLILAVDPLPGTYGNIDDLRVPERLPQDVIEMMTPMGAMLNEKMVYSDMLPGVKPYAKLVSEDKEPEKTREIISAPAKRSHPSEGSAALLKQEQQQQSKRLSASAEVLPNVGNWKNVRKRKAEKEEKEEKVKKTQFKKRSHNSKN